MALVQGYDVVEQVTPTTANFGYVIVLLRRMTLFSKFLRLRSQSPQLLR
jgi:hypothetical protein